MNKKSKLLVFGSRSKVKKCVAAQIKSNGEKIKMVPSFKYLGFILDSSLNYNYNMSSVISTVQHKILMLEKVKKKVKKKLRKEAALSIYKAMLLPYFDYADVIYCKANTTDLDKLQRLQDRCMGLCLAGWGYLTDIGTTSQFNLFP